jgi:hypothetical protein
MAMSNYSKELITKMININDNSNTGSNREKLNTTITTLDIGKI